MGIVNRRNAMLGWTVWQFVKRRMKQKARSAVPGTAEDSRRPNRSALVLGAAALAGALWFWRRGNDGDDGGNGTPDIWTPGTTSSDGT